LKNYLDKIENTQPKEENKDYSKGKKVNIKGKQSEIVNEDTKPKDNYDTIKNNENNPIIKGIAEEYIKSF